MQVCSVLSAFRSYKRGGIFNVAIIIVLAHVGLISLLTSVISLLILISWLDWNKASMKSAYNEEDN